MSSSDNRLSSDAAQDISEPGSTSFRTYLVMGVLGLMIAGMLVIIFVGPAQRDPRALAAGSGSLPADYSKLTSFSFVDQTGKPFELADLKGKISVISFIFTRCHESCPMVSGVMARLRSELPASVQLVSISVDPRYDGPDVLKQYASNFRADPDQWHFVTGEEDEIYRLIREGFRISVQPNPDPKRLPGELVSHTTRLAVVDSNGSVRGYFDARDGRVFEEVNARVRQLEAEQGAGQ